MAARPQVKQSPNLIVEHAHVISVRYHVPEFIPNY